MCLSKCITAVPLYMNYLECVWISSSPRVWHSRIQISMKCFFIFKHEIWLYSDDNWQCFDIKPVNLLLMSSILRLGWMQKSKQILMVLFIYSFLLFSCHMEQMRDSLTSLSCVVLLAASKLKCFLIFPHLCLCSWCSISHQSNRLCLHRRHILLIL